MKRKPYKSDVTDEQWELVKPAIDNFLASKTETRGRPAEVDFREVLNTVFYVLRTGCQWNMIPHDLVYDGKAYYWFAKWKESEVFDEIMLALNRKVRKKVGRDESPSLGIIDSQSIQATKGGESVGYDGFKKKGT